MREGYLDSDEKASRPNKTSEGTEGQLTGRGPHSFDSLELLDGDLAVKCGWRGLSLLMADNGSTIIVPYSIPPTMSPSVRQARQGKVP